MRAVEVFAAKKIINRLNNLCMYCRTVSVLEKISFVCALRIALYKLVKLSIVWGNAEGMQGVGGCLWRMIK